MIYHEMDKDQLVQYKIDLKKFADTASKYQRSGQIVNLIHFIEKKTKEIHFAMYIPNNIDLDEFGDNDKNYSRNMITKSDKPYILDTYCCRQYHYKSDSFKIVKYLLMSAIVVEDLKEFRKQIDKICKFEIHAPEKPRDTYRIDLGIDVVYGTNFSKNYPDDPNTVNNSLSTLYCDEFDRSVIDDPETIKSIHDMFDENGYADVFIGSEDFKSPIRLGFEHFPIKMKKLIIYRYLKTFINGTSLNFISTEQTLINDVFVESTYLK